MVLHLLSNVTIRPCLAHRAIDDHRRRELPPQIARHISRSIRRIDLTDLRARLFKKRLSSDGLGGVSCEIVVHEFKKRRVAHLAAQRIQKQNAPGSLSLKMVRGSI